MSITGSAKPACDEHVADVVHVDEPVRVRVRVRARERGANLAQRVGPERRERSAARRPSARAGTPRTRAAGRSPIAARDCSRRGPHDTPANGSALMSAQTNRGARRTARRQRLQQPAQQRALRARAPARGLDHRQRDVERDARARPDSAAPSSPTASPVPQPASTIDRRCELHVHRVAAPSGCRLRAAARPPRRTSRPRARIPVAPPPDRRHADRAPETWLSHRRTRVARRETAPDATGTVHAQHPRSPHASRGQRRGKRLRRGERHQRVPLAAR